MRNWLFTFWHEFKNQNGWFFVTIAVVILLGVGVWRVWDRYGDPNQVSLEELRWATGLIGLNLLLVVWAIPREPFASRLLLGGTLVVELIMILFLYLV